MILTCPNCATRYFVDDGRLSPNGRAVRCASCGARWMARLLEPLELSPASQEAAAGLHGIARASLDPPAARDLPAEALPKVFRQRAHIRRKVQEAAAAGAVWAALGGMLAVVLGAAVVLRQDIALSWPRTASAYAMVGLPVNLVGLAIEDQHARPALRDGHAAIVVTGALRNVRDRPVTAPPLRITLLNPAGRSLAVKIGDPGQASIPPGKPRRFSVDMLDPPVSATDVEVAFVLGAARLRGGVPSPPAAPVAAAAPAAKLSLRGATVAQGPGPEPLAATPMGASSMAASEAKPLSAASPYALPAVASDPHG